MATTQVMTTTPKDNLGATVPGQTILYSSKTPRVATVNSSGIVTAISPGVTTIVAECQGRFAEAACTVSGTPQPTSAWGSAELQLQSAALTVSPDPLVKGGVAGGGVIYLTHIRPNWNPTLHGPIPFSAVQYECEIEDLPAGITVTWAGGSNIALIAPGAKVGAHSFQLTARPYAPLKTSHVFKVNVRAVVSPLLNYMYTNTASLTIVNP